MRTRQSCSLEVADVSVKRRGRGVPSALITELKTKVDRWVAKGALTAVDLLSVEQTKTRVHTLDTEFERYHIDAIG